MNYLTVNKIIENTESIQAKKYLMELWYAIEEESFPLSLKYHTFKHQFMHLKASAPKNWNLDWDGSQFSLSRQIKHHCYFSIIVQPNGMITYKFSS
ncbi:hypothetical protein [Metabacillus sp. Hm71]|uniref:hypothetical protein n=1 Tax=Metabacillus sp. Hm71 TaxID=3450743 RepID=UPI003F4327F8